MSDVRSRSMTRRGLLGAGLGIGAAALAGAPAHAASFSTSGMNRVGQTVWRFSVYTDQLLAGRLDANIILPVSYGSQPRRYYPCLYLLHGSGDDHNTWLNRTDVVSLAAKYEIVIVMPDAGWGWYLNHPYAATVNGRRQNWENVLSNYLILGVQSHVRVLRNQSARAISGVSMGGFGAFLLSAKHPTLFSSVSSYSGALDIRQTQWRTELYAEPTHDGERYGAIFGATPGHEGSALTANNPAQLASRFVGKRVRMWTGDGGQNPANYEYQPYRSSLTMNAALSAARVPYATSGSAAGRRLTVTPGTGHAWGPWQNALHADLPGIVGFLQRPVG